MNRQYLKGTIALLCMIILVLDSKTALLGASDAIELCIKTVIPSIFPFFVLSNILTSTLSKSSSKVMQYLAKVFHIPQQTSILLICSILGGYPVGAQCVGQLYNENVLSKKKAETLLAFCNNAGPAFIFGIAASLFSQKWIPWTLWIIHVLSTYFISQWFICCEGVKHTFRIEEKNSTEIVSNSVKVMAQICAWIVLFRIIITFLNRWVLWIFPTPIQIMIAGALELANGCTELIAIENEEIRFIICSAMLAFGGLCVAMQTRAVTHGLKLKNYFIGKILHTIISVSLAVSFMYKKWLFLVLFTTLYRFLPCVIQKKSSIHSPVCV